MIDVLVTAALIAAESPGPRGDNPDGSGGIFIIAGIVVAVALAGFLGHLLLHRFGRSRPEAMTRRPAREGRVGRASELGDR